MINTLKWSGWMIAGTLFILLLLQRSCEPECTVNPTVHDTITIHGDRELIAVQDTILKPVKVYYPLNPKHPVIDTATILKDYFSHKIYSDTIRAKDVVAVIRDSLSGDSLGIRKVFIENRRDTRSNLQGSAQKNKIFIGGFFGLSPQDLHQSAGVSLIFLTRKDALYQYQYDAFNRTHCIGMSWKIQLVK
jgi:hypothetical protein